jgi:hypothetical protein
MHRISQCFVCGGDRVTFETKGGGFERHTMHDHNMWAYLYMVCALWTKDPTEYNGWEQYVADQLAAEELDFMPINRAIVLHELEMAEQAETRALHDSVAQVKAHVGKLAAASNCASDTRDSLDSTVTMEAIEEAVQHVSDEMKTEMSKFQESFDQKILDLRILVLRTAVPARRSPSPHSSEMFL